jgi:YggT family protein
MLLSVICLALQAYVIVLLAYVVLSWVPAPPEPILPLVRAVRGLVDPLLEPMRRVIPPLRLGAVALDLSILVLFFGISILQSVICR